MAQVYVGIARVMAIKLFWKFVARPVERWCRAKLGELPYGEQPYDLVEDVAFVYTDDRDLGARRHER